MENKEPKIYAFLTLCIQGGMTIGLMLFALRHDWQNTFLSMAVIGLTILPTFALKRYRVFLPPEFQLIGVLFVFLSLFLGSATDFYQRFWWWDLVLHISSGFLLGMVGWIALFLFHETDRVPKGMSPAFFGFFAVTFAMFLGVLWELFEFTVDQFAPQINMQSTETGVVDTMKDLIGDLIGAVIIATMGWMYSKTGRYSFIIDTIRIFIRKNPRLFPKQKEIQLKSFFKRKVARTSSGKSSEG